MKAASLLAAVLFFGLNPAFAQSVVTVMNNGDPNNRVDIAIFGDGYTASQMSTYADDVQNVINGFFSQTPFNEYKRYFNVHRIDVASAESGADYDGNPPTLKNTAFNAGFNCNGIDRLLCVDETTVLNMASRLLLPAQRDFVLVIVNASKYGGSGGQVAVFSTNDDLVELALHEEGHSFGSLGDEYDYGPPACYTYNEPSEPNITMEVQRSKIKWNLWIDSSTAIPTFTAGYGVPGLYKGAQYCSASKESPPFKYRPTSNSKMRNLYMDYEQVNSEQLIKRVYNWVSPIDTAAPSGSNITVPRGRYQLFSITTPSPVTHDLSVSWLLDSQPAGSGLEYALDTTTASAGAHTVVVKVEDHTDMVRNDPLKALTEQRSWNVNITEPSGIVMDLGAGGAASASTAATGKTRTGYAEINTNSGPPPYGTAVFSISQNGFTVTEAGVPPSFPTKQARLFIDYRSNVPALPGRTDSGTITVNTGIAIANRSSAAAAITYTLRGWNGKTLAVGHGPLARNAHLACFIDQLQEIAAPDFIFPSNFQTEIRFGSLEISSDQLLSVVALRGTTNQRDQFLITTTPVADLTRPFFVNNLYFPDFADGGGYATSLLLINREEDTETGTIQILDGKGQPLVVKRADGTEGSSFRYEINPHGVFHFQTDGSPDSISDGWMRLIPDGASANPIGAGVLSLAANGRMISETGISSGDILTHARVYVDLSGTHNTGVAIANLTNSSSNISIRAFQKDGITEAGTSKGPIPLDPNGHAAGFAADFISGLPDGFTGVIDISSNSIFTALTIRSALNENEDFLMTTFPVANANVSYGSPILFPHIADGGGYSTEVILISPRGASNATLRYYGEDGTALDLSK